MSTFFKANLAERQARMRERQRILADRKRLLARRNVLRAALRRIHKMLLLTLPDRTREMRARGNPKIASRA